MLLDLSLTTVTADHRFGQLPKSKLEMGVVKGGGGGTRD